MPHNTGFELSSLSLGITRGTSAPHSATGGLDNLTHSLDFNGSNEEAFAVPSAMFHSGEAGSISLWFKTSDGSEQGFVGSEDNSGTQDFLLGIISNKLRIEGVAGAATASDLADVNDDAWHHALFTRDTLGEVKMALDGVFSINTVTGATQEVASPIMTIGSARVGSKMWYNGLMNSLTFYDIDFNQTQLDELVALGAPRLLTMLSTASNILAWNRLGTGDTLPILLNVLRPTFPEYDEYRGRFNGDGGLSKRLDLLRGFDDRPIGGEIFPQNMTNNTTPAPFVATAAEAQDPADAWIGFDGDAGNDVSYPNTFTDGTIEIALGGNTAPVNRCVLNRNGGGRDPKQFGIQGRFTAGSWVQLTVPYEDGIAEENDIILPLQESLFTLNMDATNKVADFPTP